MGSHCTAAAVASAGNHCTAAVASAGNLSDVTAVASSVGTQVGVDCVVAQLANLGSNVRDAAALRKYWAAGLKSCWELEAS
jgi:hypothetical protein